MASIIKNRFTITEEEQRKAESESEDYLIQEKQYPDEEDFRNDFKQEIKKTTKRPERERPNNKKAIFASLILFILAVTAILVIINYYQKNKPDILKEHLSGGSEKNTGSLYTNSDKNNLPDVSATENLHLKRGKDSFYKGYYNDAISEFFQVTESDAPDKEKAVAYTYLGIIEDDRKNYTKAIEYYNKAEKYDSSNPIIFRNKAITYKNLGNLDQAAENIKKAISLAPDNDDNYVFLGNIFYAQNKYKDALEQYKKALDIKSDNAPALYNAAQALLKMGDTVSASEYLKLATSADKGGNISYMSNSKLGLLALEHGDLDTAEKYLKYAVNINPNDAIDHYNLGLVYLKQNKNNLALEEFKKSEEIGGQDADMLENLGDVYSSLKEFNRSIDIYKKSLETNKRNVRVMSKIAEIQYKNGNLNEALAYFSKITEVDPASENARIAYLNIGNIYDDSGRFQDAVGAYEKALSLNPKDDAALINIGIAYKHMKDNVKSIDAWKRAIQLNPDNPKSHILMADLMYEAGYLDDAAEEYTKILDKWPMLPDASFSLATIYYKKNRLDYAEKYYKRVVEAGTNEDLMVKSYTNLAIIMSKKEGNETALSDAVSYIQRALMVRPGDVDATYALGVIYFKKGSYEQAIETFYQVVKNTNDNVKLGNAYNNIGKAHFQKKEYKEALRAFTLGIDADPTNEDLRINRKTAASMYEDSILR